MLCYRSIQNVKKIQINSKQQLASLLKNIPSHPTKTQVGITKRVVLSFVELNRNKEHTRLSRHRQG